MEVQGYTEAKAWLARYHGAPDTRPPHLIFQNVDQPGIREIAVTVETPETIADGTARARLKALAAWRNRMPMRWVTIFVPIGLDPAVLVGLDVNQVVHWPIQQAYPKY